MSGQQKGRSWSEALLQLFKSELRSAISDRVTKGKINLYSNVMQGEKTERPMLEPKIRVFYARHARHQFSGGCEPLKGTVSKTNRLAVFSIVILSF